MTDSTHTLNERHKYMKSKALTYLKNISAFKTIAFLGSLGGILFMLNHLTSDPYAISLTTGPGENQFFLHITNCTDHSLSTLITVSSLMSEDETKPQKRSAVIGLRMQHQEHYSLTNITNKDNYDNHLANNQPIKISIKVSFNNKIFRVLKFKKSVTSKWEIERGWGDPKRFK